MHNLNLNKGQHLWISPEIIKKAIEVAALKKSDNVLEIGAGTGNITKELVKSGSKITSFEIDSNFKEDLEEIARHYSNLKLVFDNALIHDWRNYNKIISNIPFFLSEAIINKALLSSVEELILVVGENFKNLLLSNEKLGLIVRKAYSVTPIVKIGRESFNPPPRTASWIVHLKKKKKKISKADKILIYLYLGKGKLKNSILAALVKEGKTKNQAREVLEKLNLDKSVLEKPALKITSALLERLEKEITHLIK